MLPVEGNGLALSLLGIGASALGWYAWSGYQERKMAKSVQQDGQDLYAASLPPQVLPVLSGRDLLRRPQYLGLVQSILQKTRLSQENNARDVIPVLEAYAAFVQLLPASESHHHANPGGLLSHTLEVIQYALGYRHSNVLPTGVGAERANELQHVWTYAALLAAALHDVGKPMADMVVRMYGPLLPLEGRTWQPMAGNMLEQGATSYEVNWRQERNYADHQGNMSLQLLQRLVPGSAMAWLAGQDGDGQCLRELTRFLEGTAKEGSTLSALVRRADMESTRMNLLHGSRTRFRNARETPLVEILDEALCRLLTSGRLQLNRPGGHGFVWGGEEGQGDLLLVCPRIVDEMRKFLQTALAEGARGIPTDNLILYGTSVVSQHFSERASC